MNSRKSKKKRLLALLLCLLMVTTLIQGNGYSALAEIIKGSSAPADEVATGTDAVMEVVEDLAIEGDSAKENSDDDIELTSLEFEDVDLEGTVYTKENGFEVTYSSVTIANKTITEETSIDTEVHNGDSVVISLGWKLPNSMDNRKSEDLYEYTIDPLQGVSLPDVLESDVTKNNRVVGKYSITNNKITIQITDSYLLKQSEVTGTVDLDAIIAVNNSDINDKNESTIKILDKTVTVNIKKTTEPESSLTVTKSAGNKTTNSNGDIIQTYTIEIRSKGKNTDVNLNDIAGSALNLVSNSKKVTLNGTEKTASEYVTESGEKLGAKISSMSDGDVINITYDMKVDVDNASTADSRTNSCTCTYTDNENKSRTTEKSSTTIKLKSPSISKTGYYDSSSGNITWTISVVGNDYALKNVTVKDILKDEELQSIDNSTNVTIKYGDGIWYAGYTETSDVTLNNLISGYTTDSSDEMGDKKVYRIDLTYTTSVTDEVKKSLETNVIKNDAEAVVNGTKYYTDGSVSVGPGNYIDKKCDTASSTWDSEGDGVIKWTTTIRVQSGVTYTDMTYTDTIEGNQTFYKMGSVTYDGETLTPTISGNNTASKEFVVNLGTINNDATDNTSKNIVITYYTKVTDLEALGDTVDSETYNNNAKVSFKYNGKEYSSPASASYIYTQDKLLGKSTGSWPYNGYEKNKSQTIWELTVDLSKVTDETTYTITDTLPENMTVVSGYSYAIPSNASYYANWEALSEAVKSDDVRLITPTITSGKATFNVTSDMISWVKGKGAGSIRILYMADYEDISDYLNLQPSWGTTVTNEATMKEGDKIVGSASASQYIGGPSDVVSKSYAYDASSPYIRYTIRVNPDKLDIIPGNENGADKLTLTDTMGSSLSLEPSSLEILNEDGTKRDDCAYDYSGNTLTITIPDETSLIIKYSVYVDEKVGTKLTDADADKVDNTVSLSGATSNRMQSTSKFRSTILSSRATATSTNGSVTIYKYNSNISNTLEGAGFKVEMVDYDEKTGEIIEAKYDETSKTWTLNGETVTGYVPQTVTTGSDGKTSVDELIYDHIYRITETTAPSGYEKAEAYYFIITGSGNKTLPEKLKTDNPLFTKEFTTSGQIIYIEDKESDNTEATFDFVKCDATSETTKVAGAKYGFYAQNTDGTGYSEKAALTVTTGTGSTIINIVKDEASKASYTNALVAGTYKLVEETVPAGYAKSDDVLVTVKESGEVSVKSLTSGDTTAASVSTIDKTRKTSSGEETYKYYTLSAKDKKVVVNFEKRAAGVDGAVLSSPEHFLSGATLKLSYTDTNGKTVEKELTSSDNKKVSLDNLSVGVEYTLSETKVPTGYEKASNIVFKINTDGSIEALSGTKDTDEVLSYITASSSTYKKETTVTMVDKVETKTVTIQKTEADGKTSLSGATLVIYDATDKNRDASSKCITITDSKKELTASILGSLENESLAYGGSYVLVEKEAPAGYVLADDIYFSISEDGVLTVDGKESTNNTIVMKDKKFTISFEKYSRVTGTRIAGAELKLTEVTSESASKVIASWTSLADEAKTINGSDLKVGALYKIEETKVPTDIERNTYINLQDVYFRVNADGEIEFVTSDDGSKANTMAASRVGTDVLATSSEGENTVTSTMTLYNNVTVPGNFLISKRSGTTDNYETTELKKAEFTLTPEGISGFTESIKWTSDDKPESFWVFENATDLKSDANTSREGNRIVQGTYTLEETTVPDGYTKETKSYTLKITVEKKGTETSPVGIVKVDLDTSSPSDGIKIVNGSVTATEGNETYINNNVIITNKPVAISFTKYAEGGKTALKGATFEIQKATDDSGSSWSRVKGQVWTSDGTAHKVNVPDLGDGLFRVVETSAPDGYAIAPSQTFTIENGEVYRENSKQTVENGEVSIPITDKKLALSIKKLGENDTPLSGVKYSIKDISGKEVLSLTTGTDGIYSLTSDDLKKLSIGKTYTITETGAIKGYAYAADEQFIINADGTIVLVESKNADIDDTTIVLTDKKLELNVVKQTEEGNPLAGAKFTIYNKSGSISVNCISRADGKLIKDTSDSTESTDIADYLVAGDTYILHETKAPTGYAQAKDVNIVIAKDGTVTVDGKISNPIIVTDEAIGLQIAKVDESGAYVSGATLRITAVDEKENFTPYVFVTTTVPENLKAGIFTDGHDYYLTEVSAARGYAYLDADNYRVKFRYKDGELWMINPKNDEIASSPLAEKMISSINGKNDDSKILAYSTGKVLSVVDLPLSLYISKTDIAGSKEISGAEMLLKDYNGDVIAEWVSTAVPYHVNSSKLVAGKTYTLIEKVAPDGYAVTSEFEFKINEDGSVERTGTSTAKTILSENNGSKVNNWIKLEDDALSLTVKKQCEADDGTLTGLAGAKLGLYRVDGDTKELVYTIENTTTEGDTIPSGILVGGSTYELKEIEAPVGYAKAESITFTIETDGTVKLDDKVVSDKTIVMVDMEKGLQISKTDMGGRTLEGAKLCITSEEDADFNMEPWTSSEVAKNISLKNFAAGKVYTLTEITAPLGYEIAESINFMVEADGIVKVYNKATDKYEVADDNTITMKDAIEMIYISKENVGGKEVSGATITISSDKDTDFKTVTFTSTDTPTSFKASQFKRNTEYTLTEVGAPQGYAYTESITFYIDDNDVIYVNGEAVTGQTVTLVDEAFDIRFVKKDKDTEEKLVGAELEVIRDGKTVYSFTSKDEVISLPGDKFEASTDSKKIVYTLHETKAPEGYEVAGDISFYIDKTGKVYTLDADGKTTLAKENVITMYDKKTPVNAGKLIITKTIKGDVTKEEAEGALQFKVTNNATSESETYTLRQFSYDEATGVYTLELSKTPGGYTVEEIITDIEGYTLKSVKYSVGSGTVAEGKKASVDVVSDGESVVNYEDEYEDQTETSGSSSEVTTEITTETSTTTETQTSSATSEVKTGDTTPVRVVAVLMMVSLLSLIGMGIYKKMLRRDDED